MEIEESVKEVVDRYVDEEMKRLGRQLVLRRNKTDYLQVENGEDITKARVLTLGLLMEEVKKIESDLQWWRMMFVVPVEVVEEWPD